MEINQIVIYNILKYLERLNNDEQFKEENPNMTASEYLSEKVYPTIKLKRIINILNNEVERITLVELNCIAKALNIPLYELFIENE